MVEEKHQAALNCFMQALREDRHQQMSRKQEILGPLRVCSCRMTEAIMENLKSQVEVSESLDIADKLVSLVVDVFDKTDPGVIYMRNMWEKISQTDIMKPTNIASWKCERITRCLTLHYASSYAYYYYNGVRLEESPEPLYVRHSRAKTKYMEKFGEYMTKTLAMSL